jgi:hypothetical protein
LMGSLGVPDGRRRDLPVAGRGSIKNRQFLDKSPAALLSFFRKH